MAALPTDTYPMRLDSSWITFPPFLTIAPATPPPCARCEFAAFAIASESSSVISAFFRMTLVFETLYTMRKTSDDTLYFILNFRLSCNRCCDKIETKRVRWNFQLRIIFHLGFPVHDHKVRAGENFVC